MVVGDLYAGTTTLKAVAHRGSLSGAGPAARIRAPLRARRSPRLRRARLASPAPRPGWGQHAQGEQIDAGRDQALLGEDEEVGRGRRGTRHRAGARPGRSPPSSRVRRGPVARSSRASIAAGRRGRPVGEAKRIDHGGGGPDGERRGDRGQPERSQREHRDHGHGRVTNGAASAARDGRRLQPLRDDRADHQPRRVAEHRHRGLAGGPPDVAEDEHRERQAERDQDQPGGEPDRTSSAATEGTPPRIARAPRRSARRPGRARRRRPRARIERRRGEAERVAELTEGGGPAEAADDRGVGLLAARRIVVAAKT